MLGRHPDILKGGNVIHFIENRDALSGCIKGGSSVLYSNIIFQLHALSFAALGCRYWAEFVESRANLADEPSRCSWDCTVAASLGAQVKEYSQCTCFHPLASSSRRTAIAAS